MEWHLDLSVFATNLARHPRGYWTAQSDLAASFPDGGHDLCFAVEEDSFWFRHRNAVIAAAMGNLPPRGTFFDVGGGNGYVALALQNAGYSVVLVEPGIDGLLHALDRGVKSAVRSTLGAAGFRPGALPAVGLFDVLEHIEDDAGFLTELHGLMHAGGRIYVTVPAHQALWSGADEYAGHHHRYSRASLAHRLNQAGFSIEYLTYFFWFLPLPVLLLRSIPSRLGLRPKPSVRQARREHAVNAGPLGALMDRVLAIEVDRVRKGRTMVVGASCLAVASATRRST